MRFAVYFSGRIKGYEDCLDSLLELKRLYKPVFFCSLNESELTPYIEWFFEQFEIGPDQYKLEPTPYPDWLSPENFVNDIDVIDMNQNGELFVNYNKIPKYVKGVHTHIRNIYSSLYHNFSGFQLIVKYSYKYSIRFDIVLKTRADVVNQLLEYHIPIENTVYIPSGHDHEYGLNELVAYGDMFTMHKYSCLFHNLQQMLEDKIKLHPETMLKIWVNSLSLNLKRIESHDIQLTPKRHS